MIITTMHIMIMWPALILILLLYSSKYLTRPPVPDGMFIFCCDIVLSPTRSEVRHSFLSNLVPLLAIGLCVYCLLNKV